MEAKDFIIVGENIHCTRVVKSGGVRTAKLPGGGEGVKYQKNGEEMVLPVPSKWEEVSPQYAEGKIRHIVLGIYQALNGKGEAERRAGEDYLYWVAERQVEKGADFLDVNVDEYSVYQEERNEIMKWIVGFLAERFSTPLSIDSSSEETLVAGLETYVEKLKERTAGKGEMPIPMVNSVSLEREGVADIIMDYSAHAVVSAAGRSGLPSTAHEKIANLEEMVSILDKKGMKREKMHLDPLVLPISVDSNNGKNFLEAVREARKRFDGVHITGGLSNVSFGMPKRKLINQAFTWLFIEAGGDGAIIDPVQLSIEKLFTMDRETEAFKLAMALLDGTDLFGAEYIAAYRDGRL